MRNKDEYPMNAALAHRTLEAARAARRRARRIFAAASMMVLATAAAAIVVVVVPGPWLHGNTTVAASPSPAATAATAASETTGITEPAPKPTPTAVELPCVAVPLIGGSDLWNNVGQDGSFSLFIEPGKLDETIEAYGLKADTRNTQAEEKLEALRSGARALWLVLAVKPSGSYRLNAIGLNIDSGTACFRFTDCEGDDPRLYDAYTEDMGHFGFLVGLPDEAADLPLKSELVEWDGLATETKLDIMLERIMTKYDAGIEVSKSSLPRETIAQRYLEASPLETTGILSFGPQAIAWMQARYVETNTGELFSNYQMASLLVLRLLMERAGVQPGASSTPAPTGTISQAREKLLALYPAADTPETALARDLVTHILQENGAEAGDSRVQFCATRPLDFGDTVQGTGSLVALASIFEDGRGMVAPKLFRIDVVYESTGGDAPQWIRKSWTAQPLDRLDQDAIPGLKYRGPDDALVSLYARLNEQMDGFITSPFTPELEGGGAEMTLQGITGALRWYRLSLWVQREKGAGRDNIELETADMPQVAAQAARLACLAGGEWEEISELAYTRESMKAKDPGLHGVSAELQLAADDGLWTCHYTIHTVAETVTLWRTLAAPDGRGGRTEYFICKDGAYFAAALASLNVDTDVSDLLIAETPRFTLPLARDELNHLVAFVQDMPGGVAAIRSSILYGGATKAKVMKTLDKKKIVVAFAEAVGKLVGESDWPEKGRLIPIDTLPPDMADHTADGLPALVRWDFDVAAQEGQAALTFYANPETGQVWAETAYRLFGTTDINRRVVTTPEGDRSLYLLLTKLTFGKEAKEPGDLPQK